MKKPSFFIVIATLVLAAQLPCDAQQKTKKTADPAVPQQAITFSKSKTSDVYQYVEEMPKAPYDVDAYIRENMQYPTQAIEAGIEGRVMVQFMVDEDGSIVNPIAARGIGAGCDEEAVRLMAKMPKWTPGKQGGKSVKVNYMKPVNFILPPHK